MTYNTSVIMDPSKLTVPQLRTWFKDQGIKVKPSARKPELARLYRHYANGDLVVEKTTFGDLPHDMLYEIAMRSPDPYTALQTLSVAQSKYGRSGTMALHRRRIEEDVERCYAYYWEVINDQYQMAYGPITDMYTDHLDSMAFTSFETATAKVESINDYEMTDWNFYWSEYTAIPTKKPTNKLHQKIGEMNISWESESTNDLDERERSIIILKLHKVQIPCDDPDHVIDKIAVTSKGRVYTDPVEIERLSQPHRIMNLEW